MILLLYKGSKLCTKTIYLLKEKLPPQKALQIQIALHNSMLLYVVLIFCEPFVRKASSTYGGFLYLQRLP